MLRCVAKETREPNPGSKVRIHFMRPLIANATSCEFSLSADMAPIGELHQYFFRSVVDAFRYDR